MGFLDKLGRECIREILKDSPELMHVYNTIHLEESVDETVEEVVEKVDEVKVSCSNVFEEECLDEVTESKRPVRVSGENSGPQVGDTHDKKKAVNSESPKRRTVKLKLEGYSINGKFTTV